MPWPRIVLKLVELALSLAALWRTQRERRAGRNEAVLEQRERTDAALRTADTARARRRELDLASDGLRADDGFRRD